MRKVRVNRGDSLRDKARETLREEIRKEVREEMKKALNYVRQREKSIITRETRANEILEGAYETKLDKYASSLFPQQGSATTSTEWFDSSTAGNLAFRVRPEKKPMDIFLGMSVRYEVDRDVSMRRTRVMVRIHVKLPSDAWGTLVFCPQYPDHYLDNVTSEDVAVFADSIYRDMAMKLGAFASVRIAAVATALLCRSLASNDKPSKVSAIMEHIHEWAEGRIMEEIAPPTDEATGEMPPEFKREVADIHQYVLHTLAGIKFHGKT